MPTSELRARTPAAERRLAVVRAGHTPAKDPLGRDEALRVALEDPDPKVRASAMTALARHQVLTTRELAASGRDGDRRVRVRAAELAGTGRAPAASGVAVRLASIGTASDVHPIVAGLLDDDDPVVVEVAAWAAGECLPSTDAIVATLAEISVTHDDALCREAAVAALGSIGHPAGLAAILTATGDKPSVRRRAVIALAPFEGPEVEAAFARARTDRDWQVRQVVESLTGSVPPEAG